MIVEGESSIDESMVTGESLPVDKIVGGHMIGGTLNKSGYLRFRAIKVREDTVLANIVQVVRRARSSKPPIQKIADRAVQYFVPLVVAIAIASSLYWLLVAQQPVSFAITVFATVLVVSCPCALGIATPMVVSLGIDKAARDGILIKGGQYLEKLASVHTIVFDKTGTLTKGKPEVTDVISIDKTYTESDVLQLASSAEVKSEHPIAQAIVNRAKEQGLLTLEVFQFKAISGHGIVAILEQQKKIFVGSPRVNEEVSIQEDIRSKISKLESEGKTVVTVFVDNKLVGVIAVADTPRENAREVVRELKLAGKEVILLSGDHKMTAKVVAAELGIDHVLAPVLPEKKAEQIKNIQQQQGKVVAMVGDGINDAPALTEADIGIAMGSGTDVAMASGHVILMKSNLYDVLASLKIGRYAFVKIK